MKALLRRRANEVRAALAEEPEAALLPFLDHFFEPPLCLAARSGCGPEVLRLLLEHGAVVNMVDVNGCSPLFILCRHSEARVRSAPPAGLEKVGVEAGGRDASEASILDCATCLLAAGADPQLGDNKGFTAESLVLSSGAPRLLRLFKYYHIVQACVVLARALRSSASTPSEMPLGLMPAGLIPTVFSFLVEAKEPCWQLLHDVTLAFS